MHNTQKPRLPNVKGHQEGKQKANKENPIIRLSDSLTITDNEKDGYTLNMCIHLFYRENSERAIVNPTRYALTIPVGNILAYTHPATPLAMARYGAIFFNLNIISIYLNYTSKLSKDIVGIVLVFPFASVHEVKCLIHREKLPSLSMSPLSVSIEQLVFWNVPHSRTQGDYCSLFRIPQLRLY